MSGTRSSARAVRWGVDVTELTWPAAMTQKQAASYCGISVRLFRDTCPVRPVEMPGTGERPVLRYLRVHLDAWLASLGSTKARKRRKAA
jgi:hypothetical protein